MGLMIPVTSLGGKQFVKAFSLMLPVVIDGGVFRMPSSSGGEGEHRVRFDSLEEPLLYSCTCRAGSTGTPCWAAARALDALHVLSVNQLYLGRGPEGAAPSDAAARTPLPPPLKAGITEGGEMALMKRSETPLAGMVLNLP